jgi:hypothetical protein
MHVQNTRSQLAQIRNRTRQTIDTHIAVAQQAVAAVAERAVAPETVAEAANAALAQAGANIVSAADTGIKQAVINTAAPAIEAITQAVTPASESHNHTSPLDAATEPALSRQLIPTHQREVVQQTETDDQLKQKEQAANQFEKYLSCYIKVEGLRSALGAGFGYGMIFAQYGLILANQLSTFSLQLEDFKDEPDRFYNVSVTLSVVACTIAGCYGVFKYMQNRYLNAITLSKIKVTESTFPATRLVEQGGLRELARDRVFINLLELSFSKSLFHRMLKADWYMQLINRPLNQMFTACTLADYLGFVAKSDKSSLRYLGWQAGTFFALAMFEITLVAMEHKMIKLADSIGPDRDKLPGIRLQLNYRFVWRSMIPSIFCSAILGTTLGFFAVKLISLYYALASAQADPFGHLRWKIAAGIMGGVFGLSYMTSAWLYHAVSQIKLTAMAQYLKLLEAYIENWLSNNSDPSSQEVREWLNADKKRELTELIQRGEQLQINYALHFKQEVWTYVSGFFKSAFILITLEIITHIWWQIDSRQQELGLLTAFSIFAVIVRLLETASIINRDYPAQRLLDAINELTDAIEGPINATLPQAVEAAARLPQFSHSQSDTAAPVIRVPDPKQATAQPQGAPQKQKWNCLSLFSKRSRDIRYELPDAQQVLLSPSATLT